MRCRQALFTIAAVVLAASSAFAQASQSEYRWEIAGSPGGGLVFTEGSSDAYGPGFSNYALGGSVTRHMSRFLGLEGEIGVGIGIDQELRFANDGRIGRVSSPDMLSYNGNARIYPLGSDRRLAPYLTGGIGALTVFREDRIGFDRDRTFLTGNAGGGLLVGFGRLGVRADYRLFAVESKANAPTFFGRTGTRYAHRLSAGLTVGLGR